MHFHARIEVEAVASGTEFLLLGGHNDMLRVLYPCEYVKASGADGEMPSARRLSNASFIDWEGAKQFVDGGGGVSHICSS